MYRNLRMEHILLGLDGHIRLIDFSASLEYILGFEVELEDNLTKNYYMAPEILKN